MKNAKKKTPIVKELLASLGGAVITSGIQLLFLLRTSMPDKWSKPEWVSFILAAITGAVIGWAYRLATGLRRFTEEALTRLETATHALEFQEEPLKMLTSTRRHAETLGLLLSDSLKEKYRFISYVDENKYLGCLMSAISDSRKFEGIQRQPVRWFRSDNDRATDTYLKTLREQKMKEKVRIFIIDDDQVDEMKQDLADTELMTFYWQSTGADVKSYWITVSQIVKHYPIIRLVPKDFGLYDEELFIEYDAPKQTLYFDIIQSNGDRREIFRKLADQEKNNMDHPFIKIPVLAA